MTPVKILGGMYQLSSIDARVTGSIMALMLTIGCVLFGWLEDVLKTRLTSLIAWGGLAITSFLFYSLLTTQPSLEMIYMGAAVMGLFTGAIAITPIIGTRAFPAKIRYSGLSFSYNLAYAVFSAITPALTIWLLSKTPLGAAWYIGGVAILAIIVACIPLSYKGCQES